MVIHGARIIATRSTPLASLLDSAFYPHVLEKALQWLMIHEIQLRDQPVFVDVPLRYP